MLVASVACCLVAGCGASARDQVRDKVQEFALAIAHKDAKTICTDVFAPSLVAHFKAAGLTCEHGMQIFFSTLNNPTLAVGPITIKGSRASVVTLSGASGQTAAVRAVNLVDTSSGWRVISLGASAVPASRSSGAGRSSTTPTTTTPTTTTPTNATPSSHHKPSPAKKKRS